MRRNPVESLAIINPSRGISGRFAEAIDYVIEHPEVAVVGALGSVAAGFLAYRLYQTMGSRGTMVWKGHAYSFTPEDRLWMGRMVIGEVGETGWESSSKDQAAAAVLWSVATRHMSNPSFRQAGSYKRTMRAFSQPINPIWESHQACSTEGRGCCGSTSGMCSPARIARRRAIRTKSWSALPERVRYLVDRFVRGQLENPVPGYNDFAGASHISNSAVRSSRLPAVTIGGNTFISRPAYEQGTLRIT